MNKHQTILTNGEGDLRVYKITDSVSRIHDKYIL